MGNKQQKIIYSAKCSTGAQVVLRTSELELELLPRTCCRRIFTLTIITEMLTTLERNRHNFWRVNIEPGWVECAKSRSLKKKDAEEEEEVLLMKTKTVTSQSPAKLDPPMWTERTTKTVFGYLVEEGDHEKAGTVYKEVEAWLKKRRRKIAKPKGWLAVNSVLGHEVIVDTGVTRNQERFEAKIYREAVSWFKQVQVAQRYGLPISTIRSYKAILDEEEFGTNSCQAKAIEGSPAKGGGRESGKENFECDCDSAAVFPRRRGRVRLEQREIKHPQPSGPSGVPEWRKYAISSAFGLVQDERYNVHALKIQLWFKRCYINWALKERRRFLKVLHLQRWWRRHIIVSTC